MVFVQRCSLWKDYTFSRDRALTQSRFTDCGDALHHGTRLIDAHFVCEHALYVALPYRNAGHVQVAARNLQSELTQRDPLQPGQGNPVASKPDTTRFHHVVNNTLSAVIAIRRPCALPCEANRK